MFQLGFYKTTKKKRINEKYRTAGRTAKKTWLFNNIPDKLSAAMQDQRHASVDCKQDLHVAEEH